MSLQKVILIGGGGHCKSCIEVIRSTGKYNIIGILDNQLPKGTRVCDVEVIGTDNRLEDLVNPDTTFLITIGMMGDTSIRERISKRILDAGGTFPIVIASTAIVSSLAVIGAGTIIMHQAFINADAKVGDHCIINSKSLVEHDARIGDFCHISTGALINGTTIIGDRSFIGSGAVVVNNVSIAPNSFIKSNQLVK